MLPKLCLRLLKLLTGRGWGTHSGHRHLLQLILGRQPQLGGGSSWKMLFQMLGRDSTSDAPAALGLGRLLKLVVSMSLGFWDLCPKVPLYVQHTYTKRSG